MTFMTLMNERQFEEMGRVYGEYQEIRDEMKSAECGITLLSQVGKGGPLFTNRCWDDSDISHDEQLIRDFINALKAYKKRCEDRILHLTLVLGNENPPGEATAGGIGE